MRGAIAIAIVTLVVSAVIAFVGGIRPAPVILRILIGAVWLAFFMLFLWLFICNATKGVIRKTDERMNDRKLGATDGEVIDIPKETDPEKR